MLVPRIDINKDGFVEEQELAIWIRHKLQPWTVHEDIDALYYGIDADYDNQITWDEYMISEFGFIESGKIFLFEKIKHAWHVLPKNFNLKGNIIFLPSSIRYISS